MISIVNYVLVFDIIINNKIEWIPLSGKDKKGEALINLNCFRHPTRKIQRLFFTSHKSWHKWQKIPIPLKRPLKVQSTRFTIDCPWSNKTFVHQEEVDLDRSFQKDDDMTYILMIGISYQISCSLEQWSKHESKCLITNN